MNWYGRIYRISQLLEDYDQRVKPKEPWEALEDEFPEEDEISQGNPLNPKNPEDLTMLNEDYIPDGKWNAELEDEWLSTMGYEEAPYPQNEKIASLRAEQLAPYFQDWLVNVDPEVLEDLHYYTNDGYEDINSYLRDGGKGWVYGDHIKAQAERIEDALDEASLPKSIVVYRGIKPFSKINEQWDAIKEGDRLVDLGFLSTSLDKTTAKSFVGYEKIKLTYLLEIILPAGTPAALISEHVLQDREIVGEYEVLLQRNIPLRVVGKQVASEKIYNSFQGEDVFYQTRFLRLEYDIPLHKRSFNLRKVKMAQSEGFKDRLQDDQFNIIPQEDYEQQPEPQPKQQSGFFERLHDEDFQIIPREQWGQNG